MGQDSDRNQVVTVRAARPALFAMTLMTTLATAQAVHARTFNATPANLSAVLASATGGDTIYLSGTFPRVAMKGQYATPLQIVATNAVVNSLELYGVKNVIVRGGTFDGLSLDAYYAVRIHDSNSVRLEGAKLTRARTGLNVLRSADVHIRGNSFQGLRSDGMNIVGSRSVMIENNVCSGTLPIPSVYDAKGKLVKDGDHPDCVQLWSLPNYHTQDIVIRNNRAEGNTQGFWSNGRDGDGSGMDRVTIESNVVRNMWWNGIAMQNVRGASIRYNNVSAIPGTVKFPGGAVISWISVLGQGNKICGNALASTLGSTAGAAARC